MAEKALKKVEDQLKCSVCLGTYTNPKQLRCFHVFCEGCLLGLVIDLLGRLRIRCPICRQITFIPANGVAGLQPAFQILHLLDIVDEHKKESTGYLFCWDHVKEELKLYCETCEELACLHCILKTGKHHNHNYILLEETFQKCRKEIGSLNTAVDEALAQYDTHNEEIMEEKSTIEASIHDAITQLQDALDLRRAELVGCLDQLTQSKLKDVAVQRDQVETIQAQLMSCLDMVDRRDSQGDVVFKQVRKFSTMLQQNRLKKPANIVFSAPSAIFADLCQGFGQLSLESTERRTCATGKDPTTSKGKVLVPPLVPASLRVAGDDADLFDEDLFPTKKVLRPVPSRVSSGGPLFSSDDDSESDDLFPVPKATAKPSQKAASRKAEASAPAMVAYGDHFLSSDDDEEWFFSSLTKSTTVKQKVQHSAAGSTSTTAFQDGGATNKEPKNQLLFSDDEDDIDWTSGYLGNL